MSLTVSTLVYLKVLAQSTNPNFLIEPFAFKYALTR
ncbi:hypothetical protein CYPRO_0559 [Cyclonatronum proteinivorum]|uniref:Uncharacterized protein n=1 Tax=Cyclonatronum proteinivorum TaxID=1457365 RepID=A0A345UH92_9BACT|nr:hypothetical protein CYPRO_0559 [Cyclonatronum proteinivorum]